MDEIKEMVSFYKHAKTNNHLVQTIKCEMLKNADQELNTKHSVVQYSQNTASLQTSRREQLVTLCETRFVERHEVDMVAR